MDLTPTLSPREGEVDRPRRRRPDVKRRAAENDVGAHRCVGTEELRHAGLLSEGTPASEYDENAICNPTKKERDHKARPPGVGCGGRI